MYSEKSISVDFLLLCAKGNAREAFQMFAGTEFKHHNAYFKGDGETLSTAMDESARANPNKIFEIQRVLADGEFVAIHSNIRQVPDDPGMAVMHIFRFEEDKIVELWDFGQAVPRDLINENGMF